MAYNLPNIEKKVIYFFKYICEALNRCDCLYTPLPLHSCCLQAHRKYGQGEIKKYNEESNYLCKIKGKLTGVQRTTYLQQVDASAV